MRIVAGTEHGDLGILDKSNMKFHVLIRAHWDEILAIDYHQKRDNIITVSKDHTIKLIDMHTFDQVIEFTSPIDQALCVAAHPTLNIFSCGFQKGIMRVFNIDELKLQREYTDFEPTNPIEKIKYSPNADILVACAKDGSVAIHNV